MLLPAIYKSTHSTTFVNNKNSHLRATKTRLTFCTLKVVSHCFNMYSGGCKWSGFFVHLSLARCLARACHILNRTHISPLSLSHQFSSPKGRRSKVKAFRSVTSDSETPCSVAHQAPLSMEFSRQEYWSGCHSLLQGIFSTQGLNRSLLHCRQTLYHLRHQGSPVFLAY